MGLVPGKTYVKTEGKNVYVRGSYADEWTNPLDGDDALEVASQLVSAANKVRGKTSTGAVTLTLDRDEAETLAAVLNMIGGSPDTSPRNKTAAIAKKLAAAGVKRLDIGFETVGGGLWFKNYDGTGADALTRTFAEAVAMLVGR